MWFAYSVSGSTIQEPRNIGISPCNNDTCPYFSLVSCEVTSWLLTSATSMTLFSLHVGCMHTLKTREKRHETKNHMSLSLVLLFLSLANAYLLNKATNMPWLSLKQWHMSHLDLVSSKTSPLIVSLFPLLYLKNVLMLPFHSERFAFLSPFHVSHPYKLTVKLVPYVLIIRYFTCETGRWNF
jgi:hypothetical protein